MSAAAGGSISVRACDLSDATAIAGPRGRARRRLTSWFSTPAGRRRGRSPTPPTRPGRRQFEAMFLSAVRLTRHALPGMRARGFGRIIAVVSSGVLQPIENLGISNALRAGVVGWAKTLASRGRARWHHRELRGPGAHRDRPPRGAGPRQGQPRGDEPSRTCSELPGPASRRGATASRRNLPRWSPSSRAHVPPT